LAVDAPVARNQIRTRKRLLEPSDLVTQARARTLGVLDAVRSGCLLD
jgi:hypothetical protein